MLLMAGCAALTGCATMPDLGTRAALRDPAMLGTVPAAANTSTGDWPGDGWWKDYGDPQLAALIEEALAGSPTLAAADARARKAAAKEALAGREGGVGGGGEEEDDDRGQRLARVRELRARLTGAAAAAV